MLGQSNTILCPSETDIWHDLRSKHFKSPKSLKTTMKKPRERRRNSYIDQPQRTA